MCLATTRGPVVFVARVAIKPLKSTSRGSYFITENSEYIFDSKKHNGKVFYQSIGKKFSISFIILRFGTVEKSVLYQCEERNSFAKITVKITAGEKSISRLNICNKV